MLFKFSLIFFQERDQHHPDDKDDILEAFLPLKQYPWQVRAYL